jgi:hypothetical protein
MSDFILDGSFEIVKTKNYILSIQVCLDGFSFLITDPTDSKIVAQKSTSLKISSSNLLSRRLKEWLESEELLKSQFNLVRIFIYTENFTLIPKNYLGQEKQRNLFSILFDKMQGLNLIESDINNLETTLFYPVSQDVLSVLNQFFSKGFEIFHPIKNLIEVNFKTEKRNFSIILATKNYFYLTVFGNNNLMLANSFQTPHINDLVYNVINAFQQLGIARNETDLFVAGAINQNTEIEELLKPYFDCISLLKTEDIIENPLVFKNSN